MRHKEAYAKQRVIYIYIYTTIKYEKQIFERRQGWIFNSDAPAKVSLSTRHQVPVTCTCWLHPIIAKDISTTIVRVSVISLVLNLTLKTRLGSTVGAAIPVLVSPEPRRYRAITVRNSSKSMVPSSEQYNQHRKYFQKTQHQIFVYTTT